MTYTTLALARATSPRMTTRQQLACNAVQAFALRLHLRTDDERQALAEYRAAEALFMALNDMRREA